MPNKPKVESSQFQVGDKVVLIHSMEWEKNPEEGVIRSKYRNTYLVGIPSRSKRLRGRRGSPGDGGVWKYHGSQLMSINDPRLPQIKEIFAKMHQLSKEQDELFNKLHDEIAEILGVKRGKGLFI